MTTSPAQSPAKQDPLTVAMAEIAEAGTLTLQRAAEPARPAAVPGAGRAVLVQQAGGGAGAGPGRPAGLLQRLVVVQGGDGRRLVAVRPLTVVSTNNLTNSGPALSHTK